MYIYEIKNKLDTNELAPADPPKERLKILPNTMFSMSNFFTIQFWIQNKLQKEKKNKFL